MNKETIMKAAAATLALAALAAVGLKGCDLTPENTTAIKEATAPIKVALCEAGATLAADQVRRTGLPVPETTYSYLSDRCAQLLQDKLPISATVYDDPVRQACSDLAISQDNELCGGVY